MFKYNFYKRVFDLILAIILIPILVLTFILVTPFIYFSDFGPILYYSKRIGKGGLSFTMYKYRTMKVNSPDIRLMDGSTYNSYDDIRLTFVGKILREFSIDELPQIFNILKNDMSFIGPRPDPIDWLFKYKVNEKLFLNIKPGITGYNQAYFRNDADSDLKILNDNYYAQNISFLFDIKIFFLGLKDTKRHHGIKKNFCMPSLK